MRTASNYWQWVRIDAAGNRKREEMSAVKAFFHQQFSEQIEASETPDLTIQRQLVQRVRGDNEGADRQLAEFGLRCFISHQVEQVCLQLEAQFGKPHGFCCDDLLPLVLNDEVLSGRGRPMQATEYRSIATQIVQTFDPDQASLSTWTTRLVRHHRDLNAFLLEQGVRLISDWAILNDTRPKQLQRVFLTFQPLTAAEVRHACNLLENYHAVYRQDRQQSLARGTCQPPTPEQLCRIAQALQTATAAPISPDRVLSQLQTLAAHLRQYSTHARSGTLSTTSLDEPDTRTKAVQIQSPDADRQAEENEFLTFYRQQFLQCLDRSLMQVTSDRCTHLKRKSPPLDQPFITALQLFHCRGRSMGEIAAQVGLQAQYQVTRLLKLKEFRADVRRQLLNALRDRILEKAKDYADPIALQTLDRNLDLALDQQVNAVLEATIAEASVARDRPLSSLFSRRLCHYLDTLNLLP